MFDMRYHIVSLVAVFLALAIGIMLGSSIENRGLLKKQQERLVNSISEDIAAIRQKNTVLQNRLDSQKSFESGILPALVKDKLKDRKIAVIYFQDAASNTLKLAAKETLEQAGATVSDIMLDRGKLTKMRLPATTVNTERADKYGSIVQLAKELATEPGFVSAELQKQGVIKADENLAPLNGAVVFAGGNKSNLEEIALSQSLSRNKIETVFIDKSDNKYSKIDQFINANVDTVDNVEMVYGRISLVYLLIDSKRGHYGVKSSAQDLMPTLN